jgi:hypothetical protein
MAELERAFLTFEGKSEQVKCMFNPETVAFTMTNQWKGEPRPGRDVPMLEFGGSESGSMSIELFFDTTDDGSDVTQYTSKLVQAMEIDTDLPGSNDANSNGRPPYMIFHWGKLASFPVVIKSTTVTFEYFSSSGTPLRARVKMETSQFMPSKAFTKQNPTSGTPNPHRVHRVQRGETLDRISARYYGDSTRWRMLADANGIEDPLAVRPGTLLTVPLLS